MDIKELMGDGVTEAVKDPEEPRVPYAAIMRSAVLGEDIIIVNDRDKVDSLEREYPDLVMYSPHEIDQLYKFKDEPDDVRLIHFAKKEFCGRII